MILPLAILVVTHVLLPAWFLTALWRAPCTDRLSWLVTAGYGASYLAFLSLAGQWYWFSSHLRVLVPALYAAVALRSYRRCQGLPWRRPDGPSVVRQHGFTLAMSLLFCAMAGVALSARMPAEAPVELAFPLASGRYVVAHGGDASIVNYHNPHREQRYALDILGLNGAGARAMGLMPQALARYAIHGRSVLSPCAGRVLRAEDGRPDQPPGQMERAHPAGNHVVLDCGEVRVLLAHLLPGSVAVKEGERLAVGQPLGRVGNSGNTSEPHLHLHAYRDSGGAGDRPQGVPVSFGGRFPVRNAVIAVP